MASARVAHPPSFPAVVLWTASASDPDAEAERFAKANPQAYQGIKVGYERSKKTYTRTDYEVRGCAWLRGAGVLHVRAAGARALTVTRMAQQNTTRRHTWLRVGGLWHILQQAVQPGRVVLANCVPLQAAGAAPRLD